MEDLRPSTTIVISYLFREVKFLQKLVYESMLLLRGDLNQIIVDMVSVNAKILHFAASST